MLDPDKRPRYAKTCRRRDYLTSRRQQASDQPSSPSSSLRNICLLVPLRASSTPVTSEDALRMPRCPRHYICRFYLNCKYSSAKSRSRAKMGEDATTMAQSVSPGKDVKFDGARLNEYQIKVSLNRSAKLLAVYREREREREKEARL